MPWATLAYKAGLTHKFCWLTRLGLTSVVTKRTFPGPGASSLIDIATAGDGSLVFVTDNNQLVKLLPETTPPSPPTVGPLTLLAPTYNCATGAITFNTSGGDGNTHQFSAAHPGIARSAPTSKLIQAPLSRVCALTPNPFPITATQSGNWLSAISSTWPPTATPIPHHHPLLPNGWPSRPACTHL